MQNEQKQSHNNYTKILSECENKSKTFEHLHDKVKMTNQEVIKKINVKKVEHHCSKKLDSKQKEMINQICTQMCEKLEVMLEWKANDNLKVVDYIRERKEIMESMGENPEDWYDEEEQYLDELHGFLSDYYKKL